MNFKQLLERAKGGDSAAVTELLLMYRPFLLKESILDGSLDEDLYQELCLFFHNYIAAAALLFQWFWFIHHFLDFFINHLIIPFFCMNMDVSIVVGAVPWVKADDVVMRFHIVPLLVLPVVRLTRIQGTAKSSPPQLRAAMQGSK